MTINELSASISQLKHSTDTAVLAHSYQSRPILESADITGDSYALAKRAAELPQQNVLMCGVRFMAETVKILAPKKRVFLANTLAGCPMAEQVEPEMLAHLKKTEPDRTIVAYINTTAELKRQCDVCVTSSSAVKIVRSLPNDKLLFLPDCNLGDYVKKQVPSKDIKLIQGGCPVHAAVSVKEALAAKEAHPNAKLLVHPECLPGVVALADYVGSTKGISDYAAASADREFIIGTEISIAEHLSYDCPDKTFHVLSKKILCPNMKLTTLPDLYRALSEIDGGISDREITLTDTIISEARRCIDAMLAYGG
ncbi:MAG: quinolinate synthase NadA [Oscillospiraceae bacterium]|jgi:quinolinate synthase|nr:quinolinate synthase NadA [Oscillospiraceae bacterium]